MFNIFLLFSKLLIYNDFFLPLEPETVSVCMPLKVYNDFDGTWKVAFEECFIGSTLKLFRTLMIKVVVYYNITCKIKGTEGTKGFF